MPCPKLMAALCLRIASWSDLLVRIATASIPFTAVLISANRILA